MTSRKTNGVKVIQGGLEILIDKEDMMWVKNFEWELDERGYVVRYSPGYNGKRFRYPLHREIWKHHREAPKGVPIIHVNQNLMDNRLSNLTLCYQQRF